VVKKRCYAAKIRVTDIRLLATTLSINLSKLVNHLYMYKALPSVLTPGPNNSSTGLLLPRTPTLHNPIGEIERAKSNQKATVCSDHLSEPCFIRSDEWSEPVFGSDERTIQSGLPNLKLTSRLKVKPFTMSVIIGIRSYGVTNILEFVSACHAAPNDVRIGVVKSLQCLVIKN